MQEVAEPSANRPPPPYPEQAPDALPAMAVLACVHRPRDTDGFRFPNALPDEHRSLPSPNLAPPATDDSLNSRT
jgi:hypothetical protein